MRTLIVTTANEKYMPLLRGLVKSLHQWEPRPYTDLACLDIGLDAESREWVSRHADHLVSPEWDLPVSPNLSETHSHLRALTARPFLPNYFPGYDIYLWIDPDAWVQERFALEWYFEAAKKGEFAAVPEIDRAYKQQEQILAWRVDRMQKYFGGGAGHRALWSTYLNAGVFALRGDAPHWKLWGKYFSEGLKATDGNLCCDQSALNYAIWTENLPVHPLPAVCNWMAHLALPFFDAKLNRFCEPFTPKHPIGILHLTDQSKDIDLPISLRFPETD